MKYLSLIILEEIAQRLVLFNGNRTKTAKSLGISIRTMRNWVQRIKRNELLAPIIAELPEYHAPSKCYEGFATNQQRLDYYDGK